MIRDLKNLPKITGKEKQMEKTGKEGTVITILVCFFFLLKRFCRDKGTVQFLMSNDNTSGGLELYRVLDQTFRKRFEQQGQQSNRIDYTSGF